MTILPLIVEYKNKGGTSGIPSKFSYLIDIAKENTMIKLKGDTLLAWIEIGKNSDLYCKAVDTCSTKEELKDIFISEYKGDLVSIEEVDWNMLFHHVKYHDIIEVDDISNEDLDRIEELYREGELDTLEELMDDIGDEEDDYSEWFN